MMKSSFSHDLTIPIPLRMILQLLFILMQLLDKPSIGANMSSLFSYCLKCNICSDISCKHEIRRYDGCASRYTSLAMYQNIRTCDIFSNESIWTVEKTFDIFPRIVWYQNAEVFNIRVDKQTFLAKDWYNGTDVIFLKLFLVLCDLDIAQG